MSMTTPAVSSMMYRTVGCGVRHEREHGPTRSERDDRATREVDHEHGERELEHVATPVLGCGEVQRRGDRARVHRVGQCDGHHDAQ